MTIISEKNRNTIVIVSILAFLISLSIVRDAFNTETDKIIVPLYYVTLFILFAITLNCIRKNELSTRTLFVFIFLAYISFSFMFSGNIFNFFNADSWRYYGEANYFMKYKMLVQVPKYLLYYTYGYPLFYAVVELATGIITPDIYRISTLLLSLIPSIMLYSILKRENVNNKLTNHTLFISAIGIEPYVIFVLDPVTQTFGVLFLAILIFVTYMIHKTRKISYVIIGLILSSVLVFVYTYSTMFFVPFVIAFFILTSIIERKVDKRMFVFSVLLCIIFLLFSVGSNDLKRALRDKLQNSSSYYVVMYPLLGILLINALFYLKFQKVLFLIDKLKILEFNEKLMSLVQRRIRLVLFVIFFVLLAGMYSIFHFNIIPTISSLPENLSFMSNTFLGVVVFHSSLIVFSLFIAMGLVFHDELSKNLYAFILVWTSVSLVFLMSGIFMLYHNSVLLHPLRFIYYFCIIGMTLAAIGIKRALEVKNRIYIAIIIFIVSSAMVFSVWNGDYHSYTRYTNKEEIRASYWIRDNTLRDSVLYADNRLADLIRGTAERSGSEWRSTPLFIKNSRNALYLKKFVDYIVWSELYTTYGFDRTNELNERAGPVKISQTNRVEYYNNTNFNKIYSNNVVSIYRYA